MTNRKSLTDALQKLNEDPEGDPSTPPANPTPTPSRPPSTPPAAAPPPRRAARPDPPPAAPATMNILVPRKLHRRLRHYAIDADRAARDIVIDAIVEYLDNHEDDHP